VPVITQSELLESSLVAIPSNPEVEAMVKALLSSPDQQTLLGLFQESAPSEQDAATTLKAIEKYLLDLKILLNDRSSAPPANAADIGAGILRSLRQVSKEAQALRALRLINSSFSRT
jgi:hypothetical protein